MKPLAQCTARTVLRFDGWRCLLPAGHSDNHHARTTAGCHIYWPQLTEKVNR
jgi:hypothetical protein